MNCPVENRNVAGRLWIVFLESEIDLASNFLCLARIELEDGSQAHAVALLERAVRVIKDLLNELEDLPLEVAPQRRDLRERARCLLGVSTAPERWPPQFLPRFNVP